MPLQDDMASVAYWYQKEPHTKFPNLPEPQDLVINISPQISGIYEHNVFIEEAVVSLIAGKEKNEIRYTIDGSEPNKS